MIETQHNVIEIQHSIIQTQYNIYGNTTLCDRTKHNVIETQHMYSIIQKQHIVKCETQLQMLQST